MYSSKSIINIFDKSSIKDIFKNLVIVRDSERFRNEIKGN